MATTPESGLWIAPIVRATIDQPDGCACTAAITLDEYLTLVDEKRSPPISRLSSTACASSSTLGCRSCAPAATSAWAASALSPALRRGAKWIVNTTAGLYRDDHPPEPATA